MEIIGGGYRGSGAADIGIYAQTSFWTATDNGGTATRIYFDNQCTINYLSSPYNYGHYLRLVKD
jgi:hypothetical protein